MVSRYQTLNEERGARRAAELRRRFSHVSNTAIKRPAFGLRSEPEAAAWSEIKSRRSHVNDLLIWLTLAVIVVFFGFVLF
ncbi:hypothetical protein K1718_04595 [Roseibium porphyridii]|uniref:Uncharacterized protein n=1 Tax=Roseibium porphyridii TaxID=2866279 RepID=A0ABY8F9T2_9HYPH|nr:MULTISPECIES: hypothetical protein [Stappiaceae]QFT29953.1 hypothetical protein FIV00_05685 [Labrenzia sp. THAF82]WFE90630.1 hypothetical protein K1718_04595 [Roseibium sp. KMA01]